jgi:Tol biopolymer transport system component
MKSLRNILILATALIIVVNLPALAQSPEQLYQRGLVKEEGEGAMEEAISLYDQVADNSNADQALRAKALLHIGMCYERMGTQEAVEAYQRLVTNFPTQKNEVAIARERLNRLVPKTEMVAQEPEGIQIKQIWKSPYLDDIGTVSSDGQFRSYVHWGNGDVAIHNLISGEKKILTHEADQGDSTHFAEYTVISKNGNKIAYSWWNPHNTNDLRLIDVDNPSSRLLYRKKGEELYPRKWLSDKELVVIRFIPVTRTMQMVSFNILDKTEQDLKTFEVLHFPQLDCSPDEKYIAYDFPNETDNGNSDINIMLSNGDKDISLITHPANDKVLGWVPGRQEFLFTSDRSGSWDLWAIPIDDGKLTGTAKRIYTDIGDVESIGFIENGDCFFGFSRRSFNTYLTPFNAETGELKEESSESMLGSNFWVKWSPDGQSLLYISENTKSENPWQLTIKDLKTGKERKLAENLFTSESPCWSPDGNSILVLGREKIKAKAKDYSRGIYLVDVKTGQTTEILLLSDYEFNVPEDDASPLSDLEWSADGKSFYYLLFKDRLVKHDLESGEDKVLYEHSHFNRNLLRRSPDGKNLLFAIYNPEEKRGHLFTMPAEGGKEIELCTTQEDVALAGGSWSPNGKYIYFTEITEGTNLWRVPVQGGTPQKVWHSENRAEFYSIHPDGGQIAYAIRERTTEIRAIENLSHELAKIYDQNE